MEHLAPEHELPYCSETHDYPHHHSHYCYYNNLIHPICFQVHSRGFVPNVLMNRANDGAAPAPQETCLRQASVPVVGSAFRSIFEQSNREEETSLRRTDRCRRTYRLPNESGGPPRRRRSRKTPLLGGRGRSRRRNLGGRTTPHA